MSMYVPQRQPMPVASLIALVLSLLLVFGTLLSHAPVPTIERAAAPAIPERAQLPLAFVPNAGQTDPAVQFQAQSLGGAVFFTANEVVLALPEPVHSVVRLQFDGANRSPVITGVEALPGRVNYLQGDDPARWRTDVPTYAGIVYQDLYAGIDLHYAGQNGALKGTYTVAPGVDPAQIKWRYAGTQQVQVDPTSGALQITVADDQIMTEAAPVAWQVIDGQQAPVNVRYALAADGTISFAVGHYDPTLPLIIDPTLEWSTYLGGSIGESGLGIDVDPAGNVYVTGGTASPDFPLANPLQPQFGGGLGDAFITKFSPDGQSLIYSTYLGGSDLAEQGHDIAVDAQGNVYIVGDSTLANVDPSESPCFPELCTDVFVAKVNAAGNALVYNTPLAGARLDLAGGIAVDSAGNAYVTGATRSSDFPTHNAFQPLPKGTLCEGGTAPCFDAFLTKLNTQGTIMYSTYLGGDLDDDGHDVAVDMHGNAVMIGVTQSLNFPLERALQPVIGGGDCGDPSFPQPCPDVFVTKFRTDGQAVAFSTYLGGSNGEVGNGVALDGTGNVYLAGYTQSDNFPTRNALQPTYNDGDCDPSPEGVSRCLDTFITKLTPDGYAFVYSTYFGGSRDDAGLGLAVDRPGNVYLTGSTNSSDFPTKRAVQPQLVAGDCGTPEGPVPCSDTYITKLNAAGNALVYSTYLGGSKFEDGQAIAVDQAGTAYITGVTLSNDFPTKNALQPIKGGNEFTSTAFVVKLRDQIGSPRVYMPAIGH